jgi:hypothetical protein
MPSPSPLTLDEADAVLTRAQHLATSILALRGQRAATSPALRKRIGDRDGWVCRVCKGAIDPDLKWLQPDKTAIAGHEAHLADWNPTDETEILAWIGDDVDRAEVAWAWSLGKTWKDRHTWSSPSTRKQWSKEFWATLREGSRGRALRNGEYGTVEHIVPVSVGGTNDEANLAIAHRRCNTHTGAEGASNAVLLAAPWTARRLLADLSVLRDAREVDVQEMASRFVELVRARRLLGVATSDDEALEGQVPRALAFYTTLHQPLWDARREFIEAAREFAYGDLDRELDLRARVEAINKRMAQLKQPAAVGRWQAKRAVFADELGKLRQERFAMNSRISYLSGMSGHVRDAGWWLGLRDRLPDVLREEWRGLP